MYRANVTSTVRRINGARPSVMPANRRLLRVRAVFGARAVQAEISTSVGVHRGAVVERDTLSRKIEGVDAARHAEISQLSARPAHHGIRRP